MDGVLFDTSEIAHREACRQRPGFTVAMAKEMLCGNFHEEIKKVPIPKIEETEEEALFHAARYGEEKAKAPMFEGILEMLRNLHVQGYTLTMNTSAKTRYCVPLLERAGIIDVFDYLGTMEISTSKVDKFKIIAEKYGTRPQDMLFITDTLGDLREADIAMVPTIAVTWGMHDRSFFSRDHHENLVSVVDSVTELEHYILNNKESILL